MQGKISLPNAVFASRKACNGCSCCLQAGDSIGTWNASSSRKGVNGCQNSGGLTNAVRPSSTQAMWLAQVDSSNAYQQRQCATWSFAAWSYALRRFTRQTLRPYRHLWYDQMCTCSTTLMLTIRIVQGFELWTPLMLMHGLCICRYRIHEVCVDALSIQH